MAVLRQADAVRIARDAIVLDLGDLARQGEQVRARAKADAEGILTRAAAERQKMLAGARDEGLTLGLAEGRKKGMEEGRKEGAAAALVEQRGSLQKLEAAWSAALDDFIQQREGVLLEARQDVLRLAVMMGERITKRKIEVDPSVVVGQLEAALALLAHPTRLTMAVSPADEALAKEAMPGLMSRLPSAQHVDLVIDPALTQGSCIARTGAGGMIDASIPTQLDRMVAALMPPAPVPAAATAVPAVAAPAAAASAAATAAAETPPPPPPPAAPGGAAP